MIQAISGDRNFLRKIESGTFTGFVHSTFDHTINVCCSQDGRLYAIASRQADNAPDTLVVATDCFSGRGIQCGDRVASHPMTVEIGSDLSVTIHRSSGWSARRIELSSSLAELKASLLEARALLDEHGVPGGLQAIRTGSPFQQETSRILELESAQTVEALGIGNFDEALHHAGKLLGLGPGLTPSGDDFLTGLLAALTTVTTWQTDFGYFCREVVAAAHLSTNIISHAAISKAAQGEARETVLNLIGVICGDRRTDLRTALLRVVMIGSSSGTDIAWGVIHGLELFLKTGEQSYGSESIH